MSVRDYTASQSAAEPEFEPSFAEVIIFYNQVFDLGRIMDPTSAARRLLSTDFALCAPNYATEEIELASRFRDLNRLRETAAGLGKIDGLADFTKWVARHPGLAWHVWRRSRSKDADEDDDEGDLEAERNTSTAGSLGDVVRSLDETMAHMTAFAGLQRFVDRHLFTPFYLKEVPFVRVDLQPFYIRAAGEDLNIDVGVLIHRSGIAVLSFYVAFSCDKSLSEVVDLQIASHLTLERSEVARAIVDPQARAGGLSKRAMDAAPFDRIWSDGVEWLRYEHAGDVTLADVFDLYRGAVTATILGREPRKPDEPFSWLRSADWFAYPIVFIRQVKPSVASSEVFRGTYPGPLAGLTMRYTAWDRLNENVVRSAIAADVALTRDHAVYIEAGNTTVLYFETYRQELIAKFGDEIPGQEWLWSHFMTSALIDMVLVQWGILHTLDQRTHDLAGDVAKLNDLRRDFALAVQEYHDTLFAYGSAKDVMQHASKAFDIPGMYRRVSEKLSGLDRLIQAEETNLRTRRDTFLKLAAFTGTVLFGLVAAKQTVDVLGGWQDAFQRGYNDTLAFRLSPLTGFAKLHPIELALLLYVLAVIIVFAVSLWSLSSHRRRQPVVRSDYSDKAYKPGFAWPIQIQWKQGTDKAVEEEHSPKGDL